jgi:hypothetical protein
MSVVCKFYFSPFLFLTLLSFAEEPVVQLFNLTTGKPIEGLSWGGLKLITEEREEKKESHSFYFAQLSGVFNKQECNLLINDQKILLDANNRFEVKIQLSGEKTVFNIIAIDGIGQIEKETRVIQYPRWNEHERGLHVKSELKSPYSIGLGLSKVTYQEEPLVSFSQFALTLKGGYANNIDTDWNYGVSAYFTAFPLSPSVDAPIRFLGINLRVGAVLPFVKSPWWIAIMTGAYYTTTFVKDNQYGFSHLMGPQLFPVFRKTLSDTCSSSFYFKYSPVSAGGIKLKFSDREIATGAAYHIVAEDKKLYSVTIDLAFLNLLISEVKIQSASVSLGGSYGF